jgi:hypothetical protein
MTLFEQVARMERSEIRDGISRIPLVLHAGSLAESKWTVKPRTPAASRGRLPAV